MYDSQYKKNLFRTYQVPPDIIRPQSAIDADLEDAKKSSRYERLLYENNKRQYYATREPLSDKGKSRRKESQSREQ